MVGGKRIERLLGVYKTPFLTVERTAYKLVPRARLELGSNSLKGYDSDIELRRDKWLYQIIFSKLNSLHLIVFRNVYS